MIPLRVLIIDDSEQDAILLLRDLGKAGYHTVHKRVDTAEGLLRALAEQEWDVVLCDYVMPGFSGLAALKLVREKGLDLPFIVISGQIGEDVAVEAMKGGAHDYLMKDKLARLGSVIKREVIETQVRRERLKAMQELKVREEQLHLARKAEQQKDEFIGMVSHELKTPLTVIIGALSVAAEEGVSREEVRELIHDAVTQADRLARIVDNLLELSRYQSSRLTLDTKRADIGAVVRDALQKLRDISAIHRIGADIPSDLPSAAIDRTRMELVVNNLVENAIKYSPQGGDIRVFAYHKDNQVIVGVSDQGIGISPEDQSRLFQDFERLDTNMKNAVPGVGLGLKVCRVLVEAHGGRIWVESSPGKGSTFFFALPAGSEVKVRN